MVFMLLYMFKMVSTLGDIYIDSYIRNKLLVETHLVLALSVVATYYTKNNFPVD